MSFILIPLVFIKDSVDCWFSGGGGYYKYSIGDRLLKLWIQLSLNK